MAPHTSCISTSSFYNKQRNKLNGGNSASLSVHNINRDEKRSFNTPQRRKNFMPYHDRRSPSSSIYSRRISPYNRSPNKNRYEYPRQTTYSSGNQSIKKRKLFHRGDEFQMKKSRSNSEEDYRKHNNSPNNNAFKNDSASSNQQQFNGGTSLNRNPFNINNNNTESVNSLLNQGNERVLFRNKPITIDEVRNEDKENAVNKYDQANNGYPHPANKLTIRLDGSNLDTINHHRQLDYSINNYSDSRDYYRGSKMTSDENTYQTSSTNPNSHKTDSLYPVALRNLGNTCYMNSIVQPMFNLPFLMCELRDSMERASLINPQMNFSMTKSLVELFEEYKRMRRTQSTNDEELEKRLCSFKHNVGQRSTEFKSSGQHDAVEFLDSVINSIDDEFDKVKKIIPNCKNPVNKVFKIELGEALHCESCNLKSNIVKTKSHCLILSLPEPKNMEEDNGNWNLQQILRNYFKPDKCESKCAKCDNKERNRHLSVLKSPRVLILQLSRYSSIGEKRHEPIKVPFEITLPKVHTARDSKPKSADNASASKSTEQIQDNQFELSGVICHHGSCLTGGHYVCYLHDRLNNEWYHCDDENIMPTTFDRVQEGSKSSGYCFFYLNRKYV